MKNHWEKESNTIKVESLVKKTKEQSRSYNYSNLKY